MKNRIFALGNALHMCLMLVVLLVAFTFSTSAHAQPASSTLGNQGVAVAGGLNSGRLFISGMAGCAAFNTYRTPDQYGRDWCFDINTGHVWHWDNTLQAMLDHSRNGCKVSVTLSGGAGNAKNNCISTSTAFCACRDTTTGTNSCTVAYTDVATHQLDVTGTGTDVCACTCP